MEREYFVYIMTNRKDGVLYTGVTNNIYRRVHEHKHKLVPGFTAKYNCTHLVYCSSFSDIQEAIAAEKTIKGWLRSKKIALIESENPEWKDLAEAWGRDGLSSS